MDTKSTLTALPEWQALGQHYSLMRNTHLKDLLDKDPKRFDHFSMTAAGIRFDYSNNHCDSTTMDLLVDLAKARDLSTSIQALFAAEPINLSENRPALHTALRNRQDSSLMISGTNVLAEIRSVWLRMTQISEQVRQAKYLGFTGQAITDIVNIGIGGSDLGPKMVHHALKYLDHDDLNFHYVSNLDDRQIEAVFSSCDPATTLFIVASKSFTTAETLANFLAAKRWVSGAGCNSDQLSRHFIAVTAAVDKAIAHGFSSENILPFWDWVGGRYSVWSAVSLSVCMAIGMDAFDAFLAGAEQMDQHFASAPLSQNIPVLMGLLGVWTNNFFQYPTRSIIPYDDGLSSFPDYLQQLYMESLGKSVTQSGLPIECNTGSIIWGGGWNQ